MKINNEYNYCFNGRTKIYALADTHQESRKTATFLTKIIQSKEKKQNILMLHCGDFFRGIYPKELERDCYIKMKEANPDIEMVMTLGNNDFGYDKKGFDFLVDTVRNFTSKGIKVVCANILEPTGKRPDWVKPYTIVERDGDKNFITGFCINDLQARGLKNITSISQIDAIDELKTAIEKEKPDNVIILNHDFLPSSEKIIDYCKSKKINIDLLIGGHDHRLIPPNESAKIYQPVAYAQTMYEFDLLNKNGKKNIQNISETQYETRELDKIFKTDIEIFEQKKGLFDTVAPSIIDLRHTYSAPCSYGTFFADSIKEAANTDIGFVSTGFIQQSLEYKPNGIITNYDLIKSMPTETPVQVVNLSASELKNVFNHAYKTYQFSEGNPRFLQCSNNIEIIGHKNNTLKKFEVSQILINNEPLFDHNGNPINETKTYSCAIDSFIANGGQQFTMLQEQEKEVLMIDNKPSKINKILKDAIIDASNKYSKGEKYPCFKINDRI